MKLMIGEKVLNLINKIRYRILKFKFYIIHKRYIQKDFDLYKINNNHSIWRINKNKNLFSQNSISEKSKISKLDSLSFYDGDFTDEIILLIEKNNISKYTSKNRIELDDFVYEMI